MGNGCLERRARVSVNRDKVELAKEMTGIRDTGELMRTALDALIQREATRQLNLLDVLPQTPSSPADRHGSTDQNSA